ncbi:hypothetical protein TPB0596_19640 [Tsukamurella pulmonis]|nr:hypothetical protein TPB0596_19640 [Tsukamurella pulmonis]
MTGRPDRYPEAPSGLVLMSRGPFGSAVAEGRNMVPFGLVAAQPPAATATVDEGPASVPGDPQPARVRGITNAAAAADLIRNMRSSTSIGVLAT